MRSSNWRWCFYQPRTGLLKGKDLNTWLEVVIFGSSAFWKTGTLLQVCFRYIYISPDRISVILLSGMYIVLTVRFDKITVQYRLITCPFSIIIGVWSFFCGQVVTIIYHSYVAVVSTLTFVRIVRFLVTQLVLNLVGSHRYLLDDRHWELTSWDLPE